MGTVRLGVIGAGQVAELATASLAAYDGVALVAIADPSRERATALASRYGFSSVHDSLESLLESAAVDAVYVATPNVFHAEHALRALRAGKHVLLEKPFALSWAEAQGVVEEARRSGRVLTLAMNQRFTPDAHALRALVQSGELGTPYHVRARWLRRSGIPRLGSWFGRARWAGGGALFDIGVHLLDLACHLLDDFAPLTVSAHTRGVFGHRGLGEGGWGRSERTEGDFDVEDFASAWLRLSSGATLSLEVAWAIHQAEPERHDVEIVGSEGTAVSGPARWFSPAGAELAYEPRRLVPGDALVTDPYRNFVDHVLGRAGLVVTSEQALAVQRVLDAIYASARAEREVALSWT